MKIISREEALAKDETFYFTGTPCSRGHVAMRYVRSRDCVECNAERSSKWRKENVQLCRARSKKWSKENPDNIKDKNKKWRSKNADRVRLKKREWARANLEKGRAGTNKWRSENREKVRATMQKWYRKNPGKVQAYNSGRRSSKLNATPPWSDLEHIKWFYEIASEEAVRTGEAHEVDHIIPLRGRTVCGLHVQTNLQILTKQQNLQKGNKWCASNGVDTGDA